MLRWVAVAVLISASLPAHGAQALDSPDKSFYFGRLVEHPEALSGLWETSDGHGGVIGIHLILDTTIPGDATSFRGVSQSWIDLQVGVFDRRGREILTDEENGFSDSPRGGGVRFENGRLTLHFAGAPPVDLDLIQKPGDIWAGRLHRGAFDKNVVLLRPTVAKPNPVVGTWLNGPEPGPGFVCLHVAEIGLGELTGWSDSLSIPGKARMAPHVARPTSAFQRYGELVKVERKGDGKFSFQFPAHPALCCSHTFVGTLRAHGEQMSGFWPPGLNQAPHKGWWRKMSEDSCISELDSPNRRE